MNNVAKQLYRNPDLDLDLSIVRKPEVTALGPTLATYKLIRQHMH